MTRTEAEPETPRGTESLPLAQDVDVSREDFPPRVARKALRHSFRRYTPIQLFQLLARRGSIHRSELPGQLPRRPELRRLDARHRRCARR